MAGFFQKRLLGLEIKREKKDIRVFIDRLKVMDSYNKGLVVAWATDYKNQLEQEGHKVSDPYALNHTNPLFVVDLGNRVKGLQKNDKPEEAAALMVWLHTIRTTCAGSRLELLGFGREMWKELERGFPYVEEQKLALEELTGKTVNIEGYQNFPKGLTPEPL